MCFQIKYLQSWFNFLFIKSSEKKIITNCDNRSYSGFFSFQAWYFLMKYFFSETIPFSSAVPRITSTGSSCCGWSNPMTSPCRRTEWFSSRRTSEGESCPKCSKKYWTLAWWQRRFFFQLILNRAAGSGLIG